MTPEPVAAAETKPNAKTVHCANVKPNKFRVFISLVGNESGKPRIPDQANYSGLLQGSQIKRTFISKMKFKT
jgi:hypothetical protein